MSDRITANLPSRDFAATAAFYARLGFEVAYRDDGWMIVERGHAALVPQESCFSACVRVRDLDGLFAQWSTSTVRRCVFTEGVTSKGPVGGERCGRGRHGAEVPWPLAEPRDSIVDAALRFGRPHMPSAVRFAAHRVQFVTVLGRCRCIGRGLLPAVARFVPTPRPSLD